MKKKILLVVIALVLTLALLSACADNQGTLDTINSLLRKDYSKVKVSVTTAMSGVELKGEYILTFNGDVTTIDYWYEELNDLSIDGADSFKSKYEGTATVQNRVVTSGNQDALSNVELEFSGLNFKLINFKNAVSKGSVFDADVVSPGGFLGNPDFRATNMHVNVVMYENTLVRIKITYTSSNGADVSIVYSFTE